MPFFYLQTIFYKPFSCHQGRLAAQPMLSSEEPLLFGRSWFLVHNVTSCQNPRTEVVLPSYEKIILNLQLMLHFYFSLLRSFRMVFFRTPSELFPFLYHFLKLLELLLVLVDLGQVLFSEAAGFVCCVLSLAEQLWTRLCWLVTMIWGDKAGVYLMWSCFKKSLEPDFFILNWKFAVYKQPVRLFLRATGEE